MKAGLKGPRSVVDGLRIVLSAEDILECGLNVFNVEEDWVGSGNVKVIGFVVRSQYGISTV